MNKYGSFHDISLISFRPIYSYYLLGIPWNTMDLISLEFHGILWIYILGIPWNTMDFGVNSI